MGLDTYAVQDNPEFSETLWGQLPEDHADRPDKYKIMPDALFADVPNVLCGGLFSGNGAGPSFRGKVYSDFIESMTGESLYQEHIPNSTVKAMADALEEKGNLYLSNKLPLSRKFDIEPVEFNALIKWFRVVADNNGMVHGWW